MKITFKTKIISVCVAALLVLGGAVTAITLSLNAPGKNVPEGEPKQSLKPVSLKVWHTFEGKTKEVFEKDLAKAFKEKYPHIKLLIARFDYDRKGLADMINGDQAPDVVFLPSGEVPLLAADSVLKDFSGLPELEDTAKSQFSVVESQNKYRNKYYGMSVNTLVTVANYNKSALTAAGFSSPPKTYAELAASKEKLGADKYPVGLNDFESGSVLPLFLSMGGTPVNSGGTEAIGYLNGEKSIAALNQLLEYKNKGIINNCADKDRKTVLDGANDGTFLMVAQSSAMFSRAKLDPAMFAAAVMPVNEGGSVSTVTSESGVIPKSTEHRMEAWTFISYAASEEGQQIFAASGDLPARKAVAENTNTVKSVPFAPVYLEQLKNAQSLLGDSEVSDSVKACLTNLFVKILADGKEVLESAETAARQLDAILKGQPMPLDASDATLEAENGELSGTAKVNMEASASNGKYVNGLNYADGNPNRVTFKNVLVPKAGTYEIRMGYSSGTSGAVTMRVNGAEFPVGYEMTDAKWSFKRNEAVGEIPLKGDGNDIIEMYDMGNFMYCWIDYIQLNFKSSHIISSPLEGVRDGRIEAESGKLTGEAVVTISLDASGTKFVKGLNYADGNKNTLTLDSLNVRKPGTYKMTVCYSSGTNGVAAAKVNGDEYLVPYKITDSAWNFVPKTAEINIYLKGDGKDAITFYDYNNGMYCWIDYIKLDFVSDDVTDSSKTGSQDGRIEAETGVMTGKTAAGVHPNASGAKYVYNLNNEDGRAANRLRFDSLPAQKPGTYILSITYSSGTDGIIGLGVNGQAFMAAYTITDRNWDFVPNTVSVEIPLKGDGTDSIEFYDFDNFMFVWIDYIKLTFKADEIIIPSKPANRIEAESGELVGETQISSAAGASDGKFVKNLNNDGTAPNKIVLSIPACDPGTYAMLMAYSSGMSGTVTAEINGTKIFVPYSMTAADWSWVTGTTYVDIILKGDGTDKITFYDSPGCYCFIDYIELTFKSDSTERPPIDISGRIEAEQGEFSGTAAPHSETAASGGQCVNNLNFDTDNPNRVSFGLSAVNIGGRYSIIVGYSTFTNGILVANVNGTPVNIGYTRTNENDWAFVAGTMTTYITLKGDGTDTISFYDYAAGMYCWVDYFELTKISDNLTLEAESGYLVSDLPVIVDEPLASGGQYVNNLNLDSGGGRLRFTAIPLGKSGDYKVKFYYSSGSSGEIAIMTDTGVKPSVPYTMTSPDWAFVSGMVETVIRFKGDGTDAMFIWDGAAGGYVWLDYIEFEYVEP